METDSNIITELLTPDELAKFLSISRATVYRLVEKRLIPFYKIRGSLRFEKSDILDYLKKSRVESVENNI